jgi:hypothetical protein
MSKVLLPGFWLVKLAQTTDYLSLIDSWVVRWLFFKFSKISMSWRWFLDTWNYVEIEETIRIYWFRNELMQIKITLWEFLNNRYNT